MTRSFFTAVVFVAALAGAALGTRAMAQGDGKDKEKPTPEYRVLNMDPGDFKNKDDWKGFLEKSGGNELKADAEFKGYVLTTLAKEGWELVQVTHPTQGKSERCVFYLRRTRG